MVEFNSRQIKQQLLKAQNPEEKEAASVSRQLSEAGVFLPQGLQAFRLPASSPLNQGKRIYKKFNLGHLNSLQNVARGVKLGWLQKGRTR